MGQFRWWIFAGYILASSVQAATVDAGNFYVQFDGLRLESHFERDSRLGSFVHTSEVVSMNLSMRGDGKISSPPMSKEMRMVLGRSNLKVAIQRRGNEASLQMYTVVVNVQRGTVLPVIDTRRIKLTQGTWEQYESGGTVVAQIDEAAELEEVTQSQRAVAEDYFDSVVRQLIERRGAFASEPEIAVGKVYPRTITMSKDRMTITMSADSVQTKAKISVPEKSDLLPKGSRTL